MVSIVEAIVLSVIQGITEWFPVSSSGHLALMQSLFGFQNLAYDVFLHFASLLAVIIIFWKDIVGLFKVRYREDIDYLFFILIALIPAGLVGIFFNDFIEGLFSSQIYLGMFFILSGVVIYSTKFVVAGVVLGGDIVGDGVVRGEVQDIREEVGDKRIGFLDSVVIGLFQALAIFPGISRSGMTISSSLFRGLSKKAAVKFSFLMAIPLILGASILEFESLVMSEIDIGILLISFIITFLVSLIVIKLLLRIIESDKFWWFGVYDVLLGVGVLIFGLI